MLALTAAYTFEQISLEGMNLSLPLLIMMRLRGRMNFLVSSNFTITLLSSCKSVTYLGCRAVSHVISFLDSRLILTLSSVSLRSNLILIFLFINILHFS